MVQIVWAVVGGIVVSVLTFCSDDRILPAVRFSVIVVYKKTKMNEKEAGLDPFLKVTSLVHLDLFSAT